MGISEGNIVAHYLVKWAMGVTKADVISQSRSKYWWADGNRSFCRVDWNAELVDASIKITSAEMGLIGSL